MIGAGHQLRSLPRDDDGAYFQCRRREMPSNRLLPDSEDGAKGRIGANGLQGMSPLSASTHFGFYRHAGFIFANRNQSRLSRY